MTKIKRADKWRMDYIADRYMQYLSVDKLKKRCACIINNMLIITKGRKCALRDPRETCWLKLLTEIKEEYNIRNMDFPSKDRIQEFLHIPDIADDRLDNVWRDDLKNKPSDGRILFKYSQYEFLKKMLENGDVRVAPAEYYDDASLNAAIQDDELKLECEYHPKGFKISWDDSKTDYTFLSRPLGNVKVESKLCTNYYVYCLSCVYDINLYTQFEADACLVIKDTEIFKERLFQAVKEKMSDGWMGLYKKVKYIDPLQKFEKDRDVFTEKIFDYWYQQEARLVWIPSSPKDGTLEPIYVNIGPMDSYCELIQLK